MATKITPKKKSTEREVINIKTQAKKDITATAHKWWKAKSQNQLTEEVLETAGFLKTQQQYRFRQLSIFMRLYGNMPLFNWAGASVQKMPQTLGLPIDRPTMNVVQSCIDTLVSRLTQ